MKIDGGWPQNHVFDPNIANHCRSFRKRIKLSSVPNTVGGELTSSGESSPLGLTLRKTPSFLNLVDEMKLAQQLREKTQSIRKNHKLGREKMDDPEKTKASHFPALLLKIGSWERFSKHQGDLTVKFYYAKKKIVWEVLEGALKRKIELQWADIEAIRATICKDELGVLEIELKQPPMFYGEIDPQPRKHSVWQQASDFTGGQAPICRRHCVNFAPGTLDKHYAKLLQWDPRLLQLSQRPFPRLESLYFFPSDIYGVTNISFDLSSHHSQVPPGLRFSCPNIPASFDLPHPTQNFKPTSGQSLGIDVLASPMSGGFPRRDEKFDHAIQNQSSAHWGQNNVEKIFLDENKVQEVSPFVAANAAFPCQGYHVPKDYYYRQQTAGTYEPNNEIQWADIENHLLGDPQQYVCAGIDERMLIARVQSMCSLIDSCEEANIPRTKNDVDPILEYCCRATKRFADDHWISKDLKVDGDVIYPKPMISCLPASTTTSSW